MSAAILTRWHQIAEGRAGSLQTLALLADRIRRPWPFVRQFLAGFLEEWGDEAPEDQAARLFRMVQGMMLYTPDPADVADEIRTPDVLLHHVALEGRAIGDCDDYVILLGALYQALGFRVQLVAASVSPDRVLEHVYLRVWPPGAPGWCAADAIVPEPFGWEIPAAEITARVLWPV